MPNLYAIGDIHGQRGMLDMLIEKVPLEKDDEIVFIGDYIDRGPDSRGVVDAVLEFKLAYPNTTCLRGNHEDMFLDYIKEEGRYPKGIFTMNGGIETQLSPLNPAWATTGARCTDSLRIYFGGLSP